MNGRLISTTLLSLTLTMVDAGAALANHGRLLEGEGGLSGGSVFMALVTSFVSGLVCYLVMVWDPTSPRK
jgi:hypothetical protein